jgi:pantoate--beta-alanine ligase
MVQDLGFGIEILGGPTLREADGLAMSSRNAYLTAEERARSAGLARVMRETAALLEGGAGIRAATDAAKAEILAAGFTSVDYVEARRADTLAPFGLECAPGGASGRLLVAARMGKTRLIDNVGFVRRG